MRSQYYYSGDYTKDEIVIHRWTKQKAIFVKWIDGLAAISIDDKIRYISWEMFRTYWTPLSKFQD